MTEAAKAGWFVCSSVWLSAGVTSSGWQSAVCVLLGAVYLIGYCFMEFKR